MRKLLATIAFSLPLVAAAADDQKTQQPAHAHGGNQTSMGCPHIKDMMAQMEKAPGMTMEQKAAAFDEHMQRMREMMSKMHGGIEHK
jgi:hypothetical protein